KRQAVDGVFGSELLQQDAMKKPEFSMSVAYQNAQLSLRDLNEPACGGCGRLAVHGQMARVLQRLDDVRSDLRARNSPDLAAELMKEREAGEDLTHIGLGQGAVHSYSGGYASSRGMVLQQLIDSADVYLKALRRKPNTRHAQADKDEQEQRNLG